MDEFANENFDADAYVLRKANQVATSTELSDVHQALKRTKDKVSLQLKRSVVDNYRGFIQTSKEISELELALQQVRGFLLEYSSTVKTVGELSSLTFDDQDEAKRIARHQKVVEVMNLVEGCGDLCNVRGRELVHQCSVTEIDGASYDTIRTVYLFIFNDIMMVAKPALKRRHATTHNGGEQKKFSFLYKWDIESLVVVDINKKNRRATELQNSFKLMHPVIVTYQNNDLQEKTDLLQQIQIQQKRIVEMNIAKESRQKREKEEREKRMKQKEEEARANAELGYFGEDVTLSEDKWWLLDVPDDLDVYIAQRQYEEAVELIMKTKRELQKSVLRNSTLCIELTQGLETRVDDLTDYLTKEMENSSVRHSNPQHSVALCVKLGQIRKARTMFLKKRGSALRREIKNFKIENTKDDESYLKKLNSMFFVTLKNLTTEFLANFVSKACRSAYVVWISNEIRYYVTVFSRQVFDGMSLHTVSDCVIDAKKNAALLEDVGLDMYHVISQGIQPGVISIIKSSAAHILLSANGALNTSEKVTKYSHEFDTKSFPMHASTAGFCKSVDAFIRSCIQLLEGCPGNVSFLLEQLNDIFVTHAKRLHEHSVRNQESDMAIDKDYLVNVFLPHLSRLMGKLPQTKRALVKIQREVAQCMIEQ